ncbi:unnamed protein product [Didymodactylos carnosus]|uniref:Uncharacterized protein n=1 Tax=Didymodactylos carnosus TaxID=1234261 RepID=A0A813YYA5_9BILA|nr:unnamed protein product [Didymodactylos carnosus]CAF3675600.1 unnamed protein product [Didymodactylos carnosus]
MSTWIQDDDHNDRKRRSVHYNYSPVIDGINTDEGEKLYYKRSRTVINIIIDSHKKTRGIILLFDHAGSFKALSRAAFHPSPRPKQLR